MGYKYCKEGHIMDRSWKICPVCLAPLCGWLAELNEGGIKKYYTIHEGRSFIGSGAACEIRILNADLARQDAFINIEDGICTFVDMGTGAAVEINNVSVTKTTVIDGDILKLGTKEFIIKLL